MCQTYKAVEIIRSYSNGSRQIITEVTCERCSGNGVFNHLRHVDRGHCYKCNGTGVTEKEIKVSSNATIEMVNRTIQIKSVKPVNDHEAMRNAMIRINEEKKAKHQEWVNYLEKERREQQEHEEDMKNNPEDYTFTWDD
jgi:DnaJ-class molecular chaperone